MKKFLILFLALFAFSNAFAVNFPNGAIGTRNYSGTDYVTLEYTTTGAPYSGAFGCGTPVDDSSGNFNIVTIGSNGIPSVQMNVGGTTDTSAYAGAHISYILQTSYTLPTCTYGDDLWFITFSWSGSVYTLHDAIKLKNSGTPSAPVWSVPFLGFPLECSTSTCSGGWNISYVADGAYTASSVISVFDHNMQLNPVNGRYPYTDSSSDLRGLDGAITSWNNEVGTGTAEWQGCYQNANQTDFNIIGTYVGDSCGKDHLNYDDHPGYDYKAAMDTPVYAAAGGTIVVMDCPADGSSCVGEGSDYGRIGIDHGNGYTSWYQHLSSQYGGLNTTNNSHVDKGQPIGYSGDTGASGSPHLHFQITKGSSIHDLSADPYGWKIDEGTDPYETTTGVKNVCLWESGCP